MRIGLVIKPEVTTIIGLVYSLTERAKQHGLNDLSIIALDESR
jgi:hypothetical protein